MVKISKSIQLQPGNLGSKIAILNHQEPISWLKKANQMPQSFMGLAFDSELRKGLKIDFLICLPRRQGQENRKVGIEFGQAEVGDSKGHFWVQSDEKMREPNSKNIYDFLIIIDFTTQVIYMSILYRILGKSGL